MFSDHDLPDDSNDEELLNQLEDDDEDRVAHEGKACLHTNEEEYPIYDGYGIYLATVCQKCEVQTLRKFRSDIMTHYETDEQIEDDY